jgi:RNA polymerase sigma-70 factor (sigma-E family)
VGPQDEAAFRDFVVSRSGWLLRTAFLLTGDRGLAEDAVQSVLGRVYVSWQRIQHREALDAYCRRALIREVGSWRRRHRVEHVLTADPPDRPAHPPSDADPRSERLRKALLRLTARERSVVVLRYYADLSVEQVAETLEISGGSVKQLTHRGLGKLRAELGDEAATIEAGER